MRAVFLMAALLLAACSSPPPTAPVRASVVLLGEQHDASRHRELQREWIERLAAQRQLAAVALEMAEQSRSTNGLPTDASEARVREALAWNDEGWPWAAYGAMVMAAVRAGVPVHGANLPRAAMRDAMRDASLDALLAPQALAAQERAIHEGHCGLTPEQQLRPMARIQVARDRAMAQTLMAIAQPGRTVLLIAGSGHVEPALGVPQHLPRALAPEVVVLPPQPPAHDYCADMRRQRPPT